MSSLAELTGALTAWIDVVARTANAALERARPVRRVEVVENDDGSFTMRLAAAAKSRAKSAASSKGAALGPHRVQIADETLDALSPEWAAAVRGSRIEIVLLPSRFLFRPLDLPSRATEFLDGVIRAQIDRLTPWSASEAAFCATRPRAVAGERIATTVVAVGHNAMTRFVRAFTEIGAGAVEICTVTPEAERVTVYGQRAGGQARLGRIRVGLIAALAASGALAAGAGAAAVCLIDHYESQKAQIERRIAERRATMRGVQAGGASSVRELLERRKQTTPSSVMVMDALSALLPDHTYATELRLEGDKLQVIGMTRDAPSLIEILELSPHFSRAAFFAPTTRAPNESGERFHIEAKVKPHFGSGS